MASGALDFARLAMLGNTLRFSKVFSTLAGWE